MEYGLLGHGIGQSHAWTEFVFCRHITLGNCYYCALTVIVRNGFQNICRIFKIHILRLKIIKAQSEIQDQKIQFDLVLHVK